MDSCGKNNFLSTLQKLSTDDLEVIIKTQQKVGNILKYDEWLGEKLEPEEVSKFKLQPEYPCSVQFASGTTGQSKAALTSHFNMINEAIGLPNSSYVSCVWIRRYFGRHELRLHFVLAQPYV